MTTAVFGIGSVLMGDDALGPHVVAALQAGFRFPPEVDVRDLGTPGLNFVSELAGVDEVIVVDTIAGDAPPGTLRAFEGEEVWRSAPEMRMSPHDPSLAGALQTTAMWSGRSLRARLVGAVPGPLVTGQRMSDALRAAVPALVDEIVRTLRAWGHVVEPLETPAPPDLWWETAT